jgi:hypothetical protein
MKTNLSSQQNEESQSKMPRFFHQRNIWVLTCIILFTILDLLNLYFKLLLVIIIFQFIIANNHNLDYLLVFATIIFHIAISAIS